MTNDRLVITEKFARELGDKQIDSFIKEYLKQVAAARGVDEVKPIFGPWNCAGSHTQSWKDMMPSPCLITFSNNI